MKSNRDYVGDIAPRIELYSQVYRYGGRKAAEKRCEEIRSGDYLIEERGLTNRLEELRRDNHVEIGNQRAKIIWIQRRPAVIGQVELIVHPMSIEEMRGASV